VSDKTFKEGELVRFYSPSWKYFGIQVHHWAVDDKDMPMLGPRVNGEESRRFALDEPHGMIVGGPFFKKWSHQENEGVTTFWLVLIGIKKWWIHSEHLSRTGALDSSAD